MGAQQLLVAYSAWYIRIITETVMCQKKSLDNLEQAPKAMPFTKEAWIRNRMLREVLVIWADNTCSQITIIAIALTSSYLKIF